jgi:hypothetical protein
MAKNSKSSFGRSLSGFIIVISAVGLGLRLWSKGLINPEKLAIFLVLVVIAAAIDSVWAKLVLALAGIGFFLIDYLDYNMNQVVYAGIGVGALLMALFGFYIMFGGMSKKK